jgi:hypothetical protein
MENRDGHDESTKFFIGTEVEHSPAYGQRTLFVVGLQSAEEILTRALNNKCPHIYLGANQSFNPTNDDWDHWDQLITSLLKDGVWVTLDFDVEYAKHPWFHDNCWCEYDNFIPMISVKMPYIRLFNYNATVKIDDTGFKKSNPGIWCHSLHSLQNRDQFTDWSKYTKDEVIS